MAADGDVRECPAGCGRVDLRGAQGVATHLSRRHPDYDPGETHALDRAEAQDEHVELTFSVQFSPEEIVLLQALTFLQRAELNDLAAQAFTDLLDWARQHEDVQTLIHLRDSWYGALVDGDNAPPELTVVTDEPAVEAET